MGRAVLGLRFCREGEEVDSGVRVMGALGDGEAVGSGEERRRE